MTIDDVAATAGVSKATVSRVINRPYLVSRQTVCKVQNAIRELNFIPNGVAQSMRAGRTKTVGVLLRQPFQKDDPVVLGALDAALKKRGYMMLVSLSARDGGEEQDAIARMLQRQADGILVVARHASAAQIASWKQAVGPVPFTVAVWDRAQVRGRSPAAGPEPAPSAASAAPRRAEALCEQAVIWLIDAIERRPPPSGTQILFGTE